MKINAESLTRTIDLESAKKVFLYLSGAVLLCIPIDVFAVVLQRPKMPGMDKPLQKVIATLEAQEVYLKVFDRSTLFGGAPITASALAPQVSLSELVKDYRLKGVVLMGDDSEAIIEDARTQRASFFKKGGRLGEIEVKEIGEGFVVLSCQTGETKLAIQ